LAAARSQKKVKKETNGVATSSQSEEISLVGSSNISGRGHGYNDEEEISLQRFSREATFDVDYATAKQLKDFGGLDFFNRGRGTLQTMDDKFLILRIFTNIRSNCNETITRTEIIKTIASSLQMSPSTVRSVWKEYIKLLTSDANCSVLDMSLPEKCTRGTGSSTYSYDHSKLKREMILHLHSVTMENLEENKLTPYTELAIECERTFNLRVHPSTVRHALRRDFDYQVVNIPIQ